jgi:ABC-2 type transport system ATP-binding protein
MPKIIKNDTEEVVIRVEDVTKSFKIPLEASSGLKQKIINTLKGRKGYRDFKPLNDISFTVNKGDFFGIVGRNGSGKSTLLKTLAGIYTPNVGTVTINGTLVPFIELGVGFNPDLTGKENVYLNGALLGFDRKEIDAMYSDIVDFAELHEFMEERLKNYSSGMQVRLAFSIAIQAKGDILLLDEVLAVGDAVFQKKCFEYFKQLKREKKTVILVSHDASALEEYCNKGILLNEGSIVKAGNIDQVISKYRSIVNKVEEQNIEKEPIAGAYIHEGTGGLTIKKALSRDENTNSVKKIFTEKDKNILINVEYVANVDIDDPVYELTIYDGIGQRVFASNTIWAHKNTDGLLENDKVKTEWILPNVFASGVFTISVSAGMSGGSVILDRVEKAGTFQVNNKSYSNAITNLDYTLNVIK